MSGTLEIPDSKLHLIGVMSNTALCQALVKAASQGMIEERVGRVSRASGAELAKRFCSDWEPEHEEFLRQAYEAGRFQVRVAETPRELR